MIDRPADRIRRVQAVPDEDAPPVDPAAFQGPVPEHLRPAVKAARGRARSAEAYLVAKARRLRGPGWTRE